MLLPSIFGEDLFDDWMMDFPFRGNGSANVRQLKQFVYAAKVHKYHIGRCRVIFETADAQQNGGSTVIQQRCCRQDGS